MHENIDFNKVYSVLLAGGSGTRLWPVSRRFAPKQLCKLFGQQSLLQMTVARLEPLLSPERVRVVCGQEHNYAVEVSLAELGLDPGGKIVCEPVGRNTAPAVLLMLNEIAKDDPTALVCVFAADHMISKLDNFHAELKLALQAAARGHIVTFGIPPTYPETGYGYVESGEALTLGVYEVKRFVEKPDYNTALEYLHAGNYYWNSGIFVFRADVMLGEFKRLQPELFTAMQKVSVINGLADAGAYAALPDISLDYAIMEKTGLAVVIPAHFLWSDVGSWKSLYDFMPKDQYQNYISGDAVALNSQRSLVLNNEGPLIVANHLQDTVVISTRDAVFISEIHHSQEAKDVVGLLNDASRREALRPLQNSYEFGRMWLVDDDGKRQLTRVNVSPRQSFAITPGMTTAGWQAVCLGGQGFLHGDLGKTALGPGQTVDLHTVVKIDNAGDGLLELLIIKDKD